MYLSINVLPLYKRSSKAQVNMADYWVSQARKFCDFCKCWIADNKPSIQSHENGKRHKEAVAQRISQMTKQSVKEKKESLKIDEEMKKMEEAAMKAYLKDVESNPDYTSQVIKETVSEAKKMKETKNDENPHRTSISPPKNTPKERLSEKVSEKIYQGTSEKEKEWYEAQSDEGYTYYWNCNTGESIWEPPPEGYVSMEEQAKASKEVTNEEPEVEKQVETSEKEQSKANKRKIEVEKEEEEDEAQPNAGVGPSCKPDPYGRWKTVETRIQEPVDYQLPQQDFVEIKVPTVTEPEIKFKEKQITSIDDAAGPTTFKKRKFGARGNARQRFDDD